MLKSLSESSGRQAELQNSNLQVTQSPLDQPDVLTLAVSPREAGRLLGLSRAYIWQLIKAGQIQSVSFGRMRRIPRSEINRLLIEGVGVRRPLADRMKGAPRK